MKRTEGLAKLTGRERYVDDLPVGEALWGATVRSPAPRGRITRIRFPDGFDPSEFVIVDHHDIPGDNCVFLMERDQPALAPDYVKHVHEPILLLAHPDRRVVARAARAIEVAVEPEPAVLDFRLDPASEQIQWGDDNVMSHLSIVKGDVEAALADAPIVVEGVYETGAQEHIYIENQGMIASVEDDVITIRGSMQCPYYIVKALEGMLNVGRDQLRVIQTATGGGFGGKEEYPSTIAAHAALLALKAGRPVRLIYERAEDMAATTKRHPSRVRHRTGVTSDGRLLAQDIDVRLDAGAYVTLSPVVLSRAIIHSAGPYACEHVRIEGRAMFTNRVPFGAFRGFGNPQGCFGLERHMDVIAERLGMDPVELRRLNLIREGQATATGQVIGDGVDREAVLDRAIDLSGLRDRRRAHVAFNARDATRRRGIGVATFFHGAGFTGAGEVYLDSVVHVAGTAEGRFEVRSASTEMGQGTNTIFTQLAADRLGVDAGLIDIVQPDTHRVPDSGPTVASRTAMVVGRLVELACDDLKLQAGLSTDTEGDAVIDAVHAWYADRGRPTEREPAAVRDPPMSPRSELIGTGRYQKPPGIEWEEETYRGDAYGAFGWAAYVADVEVDLRTFAVRLLDFVAVQEIGKVLNEVLARGQIQGGVVQAIGWALYEELVEDERGSMRNTQLTNYIIPTSGDLPPIRVDFLEVPYPHGAQGAKGIGELPMNGPAPAIANAVAAALGVQPTAIPLTPERLMRLVDEAGPRQRRSA